MKAIQFLSTFSKIAFLFIILYVSNKIIAAENDYSIITTQDISVIEKEFQQAPQGTSIFLDVDDTLITPASNAFRSTSPYREMIDDIKKNMDSTPSFDLVLSNWRLQRQTLLVSPKWPSLIEKIRQQYTVYALTKMQGGSIGNIPSMENWRYQELASKGIHFTPLWNNQPEKVVEASSNLSTHQYATFYRGIFITGSFKKSEVIRKIIFTTLPSKIILVDDRNEHLLDVMEECRKHNIPFLGILYRGVDVIEGSVIPGVAEYQKHYLLKNAQWLEDDIAQEHLKALEKSSHL